MSHLNDELSYPGSRGETPSHFSSWKQAENYARGSLRKILEYWDAEDIIESVTLIERRKVRNRNWDDLEQYLRFKEYELQYHEYSLREIRNEIQNLRNSSSKKH
ncbi:MAG: hypothetical protein ABEJ98_03765 [Candidatus Nanohaloarchaea archaeon]